MKEIEKCKNRYFLSVINKYDFKILKDKETIPPGVIYSMREQYLTDDEFY